MLLLISLGKICDSMRGLKGFGSAWALLEGNRPILASVRASDK